MPRNVSTPPGFSCIRKGKVSFLMKEEYKNLLLQLGIEDLESFLKKCRQSPTFLKGRALHPSISLREGERVIVRQYLHGGLFRNFNRSLYLFGSRSFRELILTEEIRSSGIPTVQPIAAIHRFILRPFYQAYFLSLEIPNSKDLIQYLWEIGTSPSREKVLLKRKMISSVGLLIQNFHRLGFFHSDLQLKNILVAGNQLFLIDFDRSFRKKPLSAAKRIRNLLRLNRSAEKWRNLGLPIHRTDRWRFFLAYAGEDETIRKAMKKAIRTHSIRRLLYRSC